MKIQDIQQLIDHCHSPETMLAIAKTYLHGDILRDPVAAEAWLQKAIDANSPHASPRAMAILATEILGCRQAISDTDYQDICRRLKYAEGREREELLALLNAADESRKDSASCTKKAHE